MFYLTEIRHKKEAVMKTGKFIKAERKAKGLTQKELAEKANISRSYLADSDY